MAERNTKRSQMISEQNRERNRLRSANARAGNPAGDRGRDLPRSVEEDRLQGALSGILDSPLADVQSFFATAGISDMLNGTTSPDRFWPAFRNHYTTAGRIDEERFATDFAKWPPIANRIVELMLERNAKAARA